MHKEEFVYCSLRKCPHAECIRHNTNTPWDVVIKRTSYKPDKNWICKDIIIVNEVKNDER